jgi:hypothetical protein
MVGTTLIRVLILSCARFRIFVRCTISTKCSGDGDTRFFFDVPKNRYNSRENLSVTSVDENLKIMNIWYSMDSGVYFSLLVRQVPDPCTLLEELIVGEVSISSLFLYVIGIQRLVYYHELVVPVQPADYIFFICLKHLVTQFVTYPDVFVIAKKYSS